MNGNNLAATLEDVVRERPSAVAISFEGSDMTYTDLWDLVGRWRTALAGAVRPGDRVLCLAANHPAVVALYFATASLAAIFVPLNPELTESEVAVAAVRSEPAAAIADPGMAPLLERALDGVAGVRTRLRLDAVLPNADGRGPLCVEPGAPVLLSFTSGSTGRPKGVLVSHAAERASAEQYGTLWRLRPGDSTLVALPLAFVYGLTTGALTSLLGGAAVLLEPSFHPRKVLQRITMERPTIFIGVPTMYTMMLQVGAAEPDAFDLSSVRVLMTSGAPAQDATLRRFAARFGSPPTNVYACSEVRPVLAVDPADQSFRGAGVCGTAIEGVEVRLVGNDGEQLSTGSVGELVVRGPTMMLGYWRDPEETARVMSDGWFHTGDLARLEQDGDWSIVGRSKELIIRAGINVVPGEVEAALLRDPAVMEACVVGVPHETYGEEIAAAVVPTSPTGNNGDELIKRVQTELASYKTPRIVLIVDALPRNVNGKIDRLQVREMLRRGSAA